LLYFFLSYARGDEDDLVKQFYDDLSVEVRARAGLHKDAEVGFIDATMRAGTVWSAELAAAISRCRSFVALLSPRYFLSRPCGQEWQIFADRVARYEQEMGIDPPVLKPLLWVPLAPGKMHPAAARIQFSADLLGDNSVRQLMRLHRHQDAYREFVFELAGQIVESAETHAIPEGHSDPDLEVAPSAFHTPQPSGPEPPPARSAGAAALDPLTVHFVVAAPTRSKALSVRSDRHFYGDRPRDWAPYLPALSSPLAEYASEIAERNSFASRVADLEELADVAGLATRHNQIIVLLVDPWITELEEAGQVLAAYNARETREREPTTAVLIPRSLDDRETLAHWRRLSDQCRRIFHRTSDDGELYRSNIPTYEAFEHDLPAVLEVAVNRMFVSGNVHRRPSTGRVPEILETPVGLVERYEVGLSGLVLVDANEGGTVVSWTGTRDAVAFVGLCRRIVQRASEAHATVAIGGERHTGPASEILDSLATRDDRDMRENCDFVRVDMPDMDVAFHRMPGTARGPRVIISAVSDGPFGTALHDLVGETASPDVAECVYDVAPQTADAVASSRRRLQLW
jgi:FxsC-like protein